MNSHESPPDEGSVEPPPSEAKEGKKDGEAISPEFDPERIDFERFRGAIEAAQDDE